MTREQEEKLRNKVSDLGYKQSAYNSDVYYNGNNKMKWNGNGFNNDGNDRRTYSTTNNYLDKKKD